MPSSSASRQARTRGRTGNTWTSCSRPSGAGDTLRPPRLDLTIDLGRAVHMTPPRVATHVERAYEWGSTYFYSLLPAAPAADGPGHAVAGDRALVLAASGSAADANGARYTRAIIARRLRATWWAGGGCARDGMHPRVVLGMPAYNRPDALPRALEIAAVADLQRLRDRHRRRQAVARGAGDRRHLSPPSTPRITYEPNPVRLGMIGNWRKAFDRGRELYPGQRVLRLGQRPRHVASALARGAGRRARRASGGRAGVSADAARLSASPARS